MAKVAPVAKILQLLVETGDGDLFIEAGKDAIYLPIHTENDPRAAQLKELGARWCEDGHWEVLC